MSLRIHAGVSCPIRSSRSHSRQSITPTAPPPPTDTRAHTQRHPSQNQATPNHTILSFQHTWEAQSTASCCMSSDMSAFLITALRSAMAAAAAATPRLSPPFGPSCASGDRRGGGLGGLAWIGACACAVAEPCVSCGLIEEGGVNQVCLSVGGRPSEAL